MLRAEISPVDDTSYILSRTTDYAGARAHARAVKDRMIQRGVNRWGIRFGADSGGWAGNLKPVSGLPPLARF
jgi:hypothetical protein